MQHFDTETILKSTNLFWQYPVKTEEIFYEQNKQNPNYCGIPWATIIDKQINHIQLARIIIPYLKHKHYYTCCQHIKFRDIIKLFKLLGIKTIYSPHKIKNEDYINGIKIMPCPLYAVNIEDTSRNSYFKDKDYLNCERKLLYSFMGCIQADAIYLSDIRNKIFSIEHPNNTIIKNTHKWHFNSIVYSPLQNNKGTLNTDDKHKQDTEEYNKLLLHSRFSLCPSGTGPNSIRFWESLAVGCIPILLSDNLDLPYGFDWDNTIIQIKEHEYNTDKLLNILDSIHKDKEVQMRKKCIEIYSKLKSNYIGCKQNIIHYCCGSYHIGDFGGVARYDYQLSLIFPHRIFIKGPEQRNLVLKYCELMDNVLVITDNHLSCDIPNKYNVIIVHHGSALTHAERDNNWNKYWCDLCCNGQKKMLNYRDPNTTNIISVSQFCYDEFSKYFPKQYPLFGNNLILHTSELNSNIYKQKFNETPIIFGNFNSELKGSCIFQKLIEKNINIENLNIKYNPSKHKTYDDYNKEKQTYYINRDIFLQLSTCEGNAYATLDAFLCGNIVIATDVGLTYKDVPEDCYVKLDYKKVNDIDYIIEKIDYAWNNKKMLSANARQFFLNNCKFNNWKHKMYKLINNII